MTDNETERRRQIIDDALATVARTADVKVEPRRIADEDDVLVHRSREMRERAAPTPKPRQPTAAEVEQMRAGRRSKNFGISTTTSLRSSRPLRTRSSSCESAEMRMCDDRARRRIYALGFRAGLRMAERRHEAQVGETIDWLNREMARMEVQASLTEGQIAYANTVAALFKWV